MSKINAHKPFWIKGYNTLTHEDVDVHIEVSSEAFAKGLARWSDQVRVIQPWIDPEGTK